MSLCVRIIAYSAAALLQCHLSFQLDLTDPSQTRRDTRSYTSLSKSCLRHGRRECFTLIRAGFGGQQAGERKYTQSLFTEAHRTPRSPMLRAMSARSVAMMLMAFPIALIWGDSSIASIGNLRDRLHDAQHRSSFQKWGFSL